MSPHTAPATCPEDANQGASRRNLHVSRAMLTPGQIDVCLRNENVSLTTTLITKLLTNLLEQPRSTADAGDQLPASGLVNQTGRLSIWHGRCQVRVS
jgi:hypothetical protein